MRRLSKTLEEDIVVSGYHAIAPLGTHHVGLWMGPAGDMPDGEFPCGFAVNQPYFLHAYGIGSQDFDYPEGVGMRLPKGQQLVLQLHVVNATDHQLTGTAGTEGYVVESVETEAESTFVTSIDTRIPATGEDYSQTIPCTIKEPGTMFAWFPHMHALGKHMTVTLNDVAFHDEDYDWQNQIYYLHDTPLAAGDVMNVTCTWNNDTGQEVTTGTGLSSDEMCFFVFVRYPATGEVFCDPPF
jgi:hypothetical protein